MDCIAIGRFHTDRKRDGASSHYNSEFRGTVCMMALLKVKVSIILELWIGLEVIGILPEYFSIIITKMEEGLCSAVADN